MKKIIILIVLAFVLSASHAQAASLGFSLNKSLFDAEILPGTTYQDEIVVSNLSREISLPLHLQLSMWDLADGSEEDIQFVPVEAAVNPLKWFSLVTSGGETPKSPVTLKPLSSGDDFILGPGEEEVLRFRVRPPNNVAPGTYLVSMRFQAAVPDYYYESVSGPRFAPEMTALFFLRVPVFAVDGKQTGYAAEILDVGLKGDRATPTGVIQVAQADILDDAAKVIAAKVKNTGSFYFKANGSLQIRSWTGKVVKDLPLPPKYMLPGKVRTIEVPISDEASDGLLGRVGKYFSDNAYLGRYTATLMLQYPQTGADVEFAAGSYVEKTIQFWIIPWKFILIVTGIVGLLTIFVKQFGGRIAAAARIIVSYRKRRQGRRKSA